METGEKRALVIDDDEGVRAGLLSLLDLEGWKAEGAGTAKEGYQKLHSFSPDLVLLDVHLPDGSGVDVLEQVKSHFESIAVVMISGAGDLNTVVTTMSRGAETFLQKPFDANTFRLTLEQVQRGIETKREIAALRRQADGPDSGGENRFIGHSEAASELNSLVARIAPAPSPVLLEGESGAGKGLIARLIHEKSPRSKGPMVELNCAGLSRELLESELFGHEKGSFTGATTTKPGLFELASKGTIFLDEIGEMEVSIQARLLKALEDKRFRRVGGVRDLFVDFRLVAATNKDLAAAVENGEFRRDLYYRLNVVSIRIPPLRERLVDIPLLANFFLLSLGRQLGIREPSLSDRALAALGEYPWPGNVRELRNVLERALLVAPKGQIRIEDLQIDRAAAAPPRSDSGPLAEWDVRPLEEVVNDYVARAVEAAGGNRRKAARLLGISPSTLYAKLEK